MDITFGSNGYVVPDRIFELSIYDFEDVFVFNERRQEIFQEFLILYHHISQLRFEGIVWIDGSFVSRKENPRDLDCVFFVNDSVYVNNVNYFRSLRSNSVLVDAYFVKCYSIGHEKEFLTNIDKVEWMNLFSSDRKRNRKGFVQITF